MSNFNFAIIPTSIPIISISHLVTSTPPRLVESLAPVSRASSLSPDLETGMSCCKWKLMPRTRVSKIKKNMYFARFSSHGHIFKSSQLFVSHYGLVVSCGRASPRLPPAREFARLKTRERKVGTGGYGNMFITRVVCWIVNKILKHVNG